MGRFNIKKNYLTFSQAVPFLISFKVLEVNDLDLNLDCFLVLTTRDTL